MTFLLGLFRGVWKYLAIVGGAVASVAAIYLAGKKAGRDEEKVENLEDAADAEDKMDDVPEPGSDDVDNVLRDPDKPF